MQQSESDGDCDLSGKANSRRRQARQLWRCHSHPDNFTDSSFLSELVINARVKPRNYWQVVFASKVVAQQMGIVACVISLSVQLHQRIPVTLQGLLSVGTLLKGNGVVAAALLVPYLASKPAQQPQRKPRKALWQFAGGTFESSGGQLRHGTRRITLLVVGTFLLSPLLQTLTRSISSDTIVATSAYATTAHLVLHDYNFAASVTDKLSGSLSLAAGIFSSVLLASRLSSRSQVFSQILVSMQAYLLLPYVQRSVAIASPSTSAAIAVMTAVGGASLIASLSSVAAVAYSFAIAFVSLACPYWLVRANKYKAQITGPWDEAAPQLPHALQQPQS